MDIRPSRLQENLLFRIAGPLVAAIVVIVVCLTSFFIYRSRDVKTNATSSHQVLGDESFCGVISRETLVENLSFDVTDYLFRNYPSGEGQVGRYKCELRSVGSDATAHQLMIRYQVAHTVDIKEYSSGANFNRISDHATTSRGEGWVSTDGRRFVWFYPNNMVLDVWMADENNNNWKPSEQLSASLGGLFKELVSSVPEYNSRQGYVYATPSPASS